MITKLRPKMATLGPKIPRSGPKLGPDIAEFGPKVTRMVKLAAKIAYTRTSQ